MKKFNKKIEIFKFKFNFLIDIKLNLKYNIFKPKIKF